MFASNTAEVLKIREKTKSQGFFTKLLYIHKKIKQAAQLESMSKAMFKVAPLNQSQIENIRQLENKLGFCLVAYEHLLEIEENKYMILNRISSLLDEYMDLCKSDIPAETKIVASQVSVRNKKSNTVNDFNEFFQQ